MAGFIPNPKGETDAAYVKGWLMAEEEKRAQKQDMRQERTLQMAEETQGWQRQMFQREQAIQAGMAQAGEEGGYEGVIDFLKTTDPERALKFHTAKVGLDRSMMKNEMYAAMMPIKKMAALAEGYKVLGQMSEAINQAKDIDQAQNMYKEMLPMIRAVNPDAPEDFQSAAPMLMLASAQAMPQNMLYGSNKQMMTSESIIGKIDMDIKSRLQAGVSPDDPGIQALMQARDGESSKYTQANLMKTRTELSMFKNENDIAKQKFQATQTINKALNQESKDFLTNLDTFTEAKGILEELQTNPSNPNAQIGLTRLFVKMYNKGAITDRDALIGFSAVGFQEFQKNITSYATGQRVWTNPDEIKNISNVINRVLDSKLQRQQILESQYQQTLSDQLNAKGEPLVDWNNVRKPSQQYLDSVSQSKSQVSPEETQLTEAWERFKNNPKNKSKLKQGEQIYQQKLQEIRNGQ